MNNKIRVPWNCPYNLKTKLNVDPYDSESKYSEAFRAWCEDITEKVNKLSLMRKRRTMDNLNAVCFWLIKKCRETNADQMKQNLTNVTEHGQNIGDWEIIVRKISHPKPEEVGG